MSHLKAFIAACTDVTLPVITFTRDFVNKSFEPLLPKICFRHYMYLPFGDTKVSSFVESYNAVMATSKTGPKPNHSLVTAFVRILDDCRRKFTRVRAAKEKDLGRTLTLKTDNDDPAMVIQNHAARNLSRHLTPKSVQRIIQQWNMAPSYVAIERLCNEDGVLRRFFVCRHPQIPPRLDAAVPTWRHTRLVDVVRCRNATFIRCSCGFAHRTGVPCRHIYSLMSELPNVSQCTAQCMKQYEMKYGRDNHFTTTIDRHCPGCIVGLVPIFNETIGSSDSTGFVIPIDQELPADVWKYVVSCHQSPILEVGSARYNSEEAPVDIVMETSGLPPMKITDDVSTITTESFTSYTTYESNDQPILRSSPKKYIAPHPSMEKLPNETDKAHLERIRDVARLQLLKAVTKAKTVNEITHCYNRTVHLTTELEMKHAAEDPYNTIRDNLGGTLSAAIPSRHGPEKKRLKMVCERGQKKKRKHTIL